MDDQIYLMDAGGVKSLTAQPFDKEDELQTLIARHPELLAWEQMSQDGAKRWILVRREQGIAKESGAGNWWSVDHLFIDQDAVPTLVEVKRGADTRLRREVVGQMLEYAAHAWQTWTADSLRQAFGEGSADPDAELCDRLEIEDGDADEFWRRVGDNLAAKRLRLLFVADDMPDELTRIVEFLNATMPNVDVLAVEIKKFDGDSGIRTLVPRVIGRTAKPATSKSPKLDRESFFASFEDNAVEQAVRRLLNVADNYQKQSMGTTGISIRCPCPGVKKWVSVAWINPPGVAGWMGLKDFTFGHLPFTDNDPPELQKLLEAWRTRFSEDQFAQDVSGGWGQGWRIAAGDAALHIDPLAKRLDKVLSDLRSLEVP